MNKIRNPQKGGSYTNQRLTLFPSILAILLGIVLGVCSTSAFAQVPDPVDDNPPGLFEIGLNEDTLEDVDFQFTKGKNAGVWDLRANILGCFVADTNGAVATDCRGPNDSASDMPSTPPPGNGPDWGDLFTGVMNGPDRVYVHPTFKDEVGYDEDSPFDFLPVPNGIDDYLDYGAITAVFIGDHISAKTEVDDTTMVSNGSDSNDHLINTYGWGTDSVPSKDDITNTYCYATSNELDDLIIYCGVERLSNDGASHVDIELNKNFVGLDEAPPCDDLDDPNDSKECFFVGDRAEGDLMASLNFTQGGDFGDLSIRTWDDTLQTWGDPIVELGAEGCNSDNGISAGAVCGYNNNDDINGGPWPNFNKTPVPVDTDPEFTDGMLLRNAFSEFGLNVTEVLGEAQCISYIQIKTRTSHSFSSQLKDFAIRPFPVCGSTIRTEIHAAHAAEVPGVDIQDSTQKADIVIHDFAEVAVTGPGVTEDPTGLVDFYFYANGTCAGESMGDGYDDIGVDLVTGDPNDGISSSTARSADISGLSPGNYSFHANFIPSEGSEFPAAILPSEHCEDITIDKYESVIWTEIHDATDASHATDIQNTEVLVGLSLHDHAYVEEKDGISGAPAPTGNVVFMIYQDLECKEGPLGSYVGKTWNQVITLGTGEALTETFAPLGNDTFSIFASYAGDANYNAATYRYRYEGYEDPPATLCEPLRVKLWQPRILTKVIVRDLAEVSGDMPNTPPTGTVKFETYRTANCSGTAVDTVTRPLSGVGVAEQLAESEQLLHVEIANWDVVSYRATYSGDLYYEGNVVHNCELVQFSLPQ